MSSQLVQLNYDELAQCVRQFHNEGEDIAVLHMHTCQRVQDLHSEWTGEAADAFFAEMEELLPALLKVSAALIASQDVLNKVMQIIYSADEETAVIFKQGIDFSAGGMLSSMTLGKIGRTSSSDDFGASQFQQTGPAGGGAFSRLPHGVSMEDVIAAKNAKNESDIEIEMLASESTAPEGSTAAGPGGGAGGGSSGQGLQGDLKGMASAMSGVQPHQGASVGGSAPGAEGLADHDFIGGTVGSEGDLSSPAVHSIPAGGNAPPPIESDGASAGLAAAAGGGIAAGMAKAIKESKKKK